MSLKEIAIIGGGVIGSTTALYLAKLGHNVVIIDPHIYNENTFNRYRTASMASLGVLMGNTFRRSTGRSWRLRQRSMKLWPELIKRINISEIGLELETPLIQLANGLKELEFMNKLSNERANLGVKILKNNLKVSRDRQWPNGKYGGLISKNDGRINPIKLLKCLMISLQKLKVSKRRFSNK